VPCSRSANPKEGDLVNDTPNKTSNLYQTVVALTASELQVVEAWRQAQSIESREEALRRLVQFGLLTEIREFYDDARDVGLELIQKAVDGRDE